MDALVEFRTVSKRYGKHLELECEASKRRTRPCTPVEVAAFPPADGIRPGVTVYLSWEPEKSLLFPSGNP